MIKAPKEVSWKLSGVKWLSPTLFSLFLVKQTSFTLISHFCFSSLGFVQFLCLLNMK